jgi:hypothetical protein
LIVAWESFPAALAARPVLFVCAWVAGQTGLALMLAADIYLSFCSGKSW